MRPVINMLLALLAFALHPVVGAETLSGYTYLTPEMQELQDDDFGNPGLLTVDRGRALFAAPGTGGKSCGSCHGEEGNELDSRQIARYPVYDARAEKPLTLRGQVLQCWTDRLGNPPLAYADPRALQLETFVRFLARGETVAVEVDAALQPYYAAGEKLYRTRRLSCRGHFPWPDHDPGTVQRIPRVPLYHGQDCRLAGAHNGMPDEPARTTLCRGLRRVPGPRGIHGCAQQRSENRDARDPLLSRGGAVFAQSG